MHNYDAGETATSGPVWAIAQTTDGTLFVGSNRLSIFNGHTWQMLPIGKAYAFRALAAERPRVGTATAPGRNGDGRPRTVALPAEHDAADPPRVWVGAIGAIGYLEKQPTGKWEFVSLARPLQMAGVVDAGDIWQVHAHGGGAVFITTDRVLRWNGRAFESWSMPARPHLLSWADGADVLVYQQGRGLWRVRAQSEPELEIADALLPARPITWFGPLQRRADDGTTTALIGLGAEAYRLTGRADANGAISEPRFERLDNLSSVLRDIVPTYAARIDPTLAMPSARGGTFPPGAFLPAPPNGAQSPPSTFQPQAVGNEAGRRLHGYTELFAIGTYRAGVVLVDSAGQVRGRIDRKTGLDDDNVTGLHSERDGRLWIGHGSGFGRVDAVARAAFFPHRASFGSGLPRAVLAHGGQPYVLTSRGFFRVDPAASAGGSAEVHPAGERTRATRFVPLLEAQGMLHAAAVIDEHVWIGGFGGMWRVTPTGAEQEYFSATDVVQLAPSGTHPGEILFIEGYELKMLRRTERGWASRSLEARVHDTPVSLLELDADANGSRAGVWVSTITGGIYRFAWPASRGGERPLLRLAAHYQDGRGLPRDTRNPRLTRIGAQLHALTEAGVLALRADGRAFEPAPELEGFAAVAAHTTTGGTQDPSAGRAAFWIAQPRALAGLGSHALLRVHAADAPDAALVLQPLDSAGLDHVGQIAAAGMVRAGDEATLWIAGTDGILSLDTTQLRPPAVPRAARFLEVMTDETHRPIAARAAAQEQAPWEPAVKRVSFSYTAPGAAAGETVFFQTRLTGVESAWSPATRAMSREFTGLRPGVYTFEVRALDGLGRAGAPATYPFAIAPPWFVRWPAWTGYAVAAAAAAGLLMRWRMVRLRRQNEKLNRLVAERTRELELSNTVRAEFLENVSHEIRNPLNGLNGLLGILKQSSLPPHERALMESLQSCARNLNRTYEEVLGFSKLEYGYITKDERPFSLRGMLREIADSFAWQAAQQGCTITIEPPERTGTGDPATVLGKRTPKDGAPGPTCDDAFVGDADKLRTIVTNFVGNALKYAPHHPIELKIEQHPIDDVRASVCIEVCDHGPGIPPEEQGLIFQKFVRGTNAKSGQVAGTGLGLATCRVMAKALGGSVGVESEPGRGSVFFVRIPLMRAPDAAPAGTAEPAAVPPAPDSPVRPAALIVEDEHYNQTVLQGIVVTLGYDAAIASSAPEAAARLASRSFDLILLDWELPGLKGGEIARQIRAGPHGEKPVIIATTGHDSDEMRQRCHEAGMDDFLLKPYDLDAIRRCVARVVEARAAKPTGGTPVPRGTDVPPVFSSRPPTTMRRVNHDLNLRAFEYYAAGAPQKARDAARDYVAALDRELLILERAVSAADGESIAQAAHRARALGGLLSAAEFTEAARRLELVAHPGTDEQRRDAFRALRAAGESLKDRLAPHHCPSTPVAGG